jgi:hypothetical protein
MLEKKKEKYKIWKAKPAEKKKEATIDRMHITVHDACFYNVQCTN